jgi:hypothetical protein
VPVSGLSIQIHAFIGNNKVLKETSSTGWSLVSNTRHDYAHSASLNCFYSNPAKGGFDVL